MRVTLVSEWPGGDVGGISPWQKFPYPIRLRNENGGWKKYTKRSTVI